jgi:Fe-S cluster biosynthesis and repair protein YggX
VFPHVPGCASHDTNEEMIIRTCINDLTEQQEECNKIDLLLAMSLTTANATTLFVEDFENRVKSLHKKEKSKVEKRMLRKDLDLAEQLDSATAKVSKSIESIQDSWNKHMSMFLEEAEKHLEDMDAQFRHYIQSHVDRLFKTDGVYDEKKYTAYLSNAGEFCTTLLDFTKEMHKQENRSFSLTEKDYSRYKIKD